MAKGKRPSRVTFDLVRSPFFRVVHSNGAWGGLTPRRQLSVTFYSERNSVPRQITHEITTDGKLGPVVSRDTTDNVRRELEVEVMMDMEEAVSLHAWLGTKIDE